MAIKNHREMKDEASLTEEHWEGMKTGSDGYPRKTLSNQYLIAGQGYDDNQSNSFEAKQITIVGL